MNKKQKKWLIRILISVVLYIVALVFEYIVGQSRMMEMVALFIFLIAYLVAGYTVLKTAAYNIAHGKVFDENFLMAIASIGALAIGEYPEAVAVMIFYQVGELFQSVAVDKSRKSISDLMDIRPDYANQKQADGSLKVVDPYDVKIGDIIVVKPGEKIPLDGEVIEGESYIDTSALTGESVPRTVHIGDMVISGCVNTSGLLNIKTSKEFGESTVSKILDLVENASSKKSASENFITRFAAVYTPIVVLSAVAIAFIPPIIIAPHNFVTWIYRALTFLVVSCPCALVISVPLSFFGGIGASSRYGVLVKGSNYLEALAKTEIVVCDKTGTLTRGIFEVQHIYMGSNAGDIQGGMDENRLIEYGAYAESNSTHPIAKSIRKEYKGDIDETQIESVVEEAGHGLIAKTMGHEIMIGNAKLMEAHHITYEKISDIGTLVYVAIDGIYAGCIVIADTIKNDAKTAILGLKKIGVKKTVMLTGDSKSVGESVAHQIGIDEVYTEMLPGDKVDKVESLIKQKTEKGKLVFVGDGINDAPVLARADVGVAMGGLGSDAAIEAADVVIMTDEPSRLITAIKIAEKTLRIAKQNIFFALFVKVLILVLAAFGKANMWAAVFADVGVAVIAILNSMRNLTYKENNVI